MFHPPSAMTGADLAVVRTAREDVTIARGPSSAPVGHDRWYRRGESFFAGLLYELLRGRLSRG